jgi:peroxiredoxin
MDIEDPAARSRRQDRLDFAPLTLTEVFLVSVPAVGDVAPDFTLASTSGEPVTLSKLQGKTNVLLAFFPLAFTGTCTAELCEFRDNFDALTGYGVQVLPISVDSVPTLNEFKGKHHFRTDLLSDFKRDASRAYGVLIPELFFSNRAYFLIDKTGRVRWAHVEATPGQKREFTDIVAEIKKLG